MAAASKSSVLAVAVAFAVAVLVLSAHGGNAAVPSEGCFDAYGSRGSTLLAINDQFSTVGRCAAYWYCS